MQQKIRSLDELAAMRPEWKNRTVVWTNGCFDLIHAGHVRSLQAAKALGDILVVGLNSDESVHAIKGKGRPLMCQEDRAAVMAAMECVDYVTIFTETDPGAALAKLRPDIHTKGADYATREIPERAVVESYGGRICFLPLLPGRSTTGLVERLCGS
jgi:D-beta-D-heptose 7-phosphate kinase/D-beta-D-heptose 1-phosphate adenosyltransferase